MSDTITIPGAVDIHVHFREPGDNKAETIKSGSKAALFGGYVLVCDMPNNPGNPTWSLKKLREKHKIIKNTSYIPIATYAGSQPESKNLDELVKMAAISIGLKLYGAATTGNHIDYEPNQFAKIVQTWHSVAPDKPIMLHSGKDNLDEFIKLIAVKNRHHLHVCHVFSQQQATTAYTAKKKGLPVTSGVCPHHLFKTSHHTATEGWFTRMQPPPLHQDEADELFKMFVNGQIDVLETDHAPHSADSKWAAEEENPEGIHDPKHVTCFGVPGIEFALPLLFYQMKRGRISLDRIVEVTSTSPSKIIGVKIAKNTKVTWRMDQYRIGDKYPSGISGSGWTPYLNNIGVGIVEKLQINSIKLIENTERTSKLSTVSNRGDEV